MHIHEHTSRRAGAATGARPGGARRRARAAVGAAAGASVLAIGLVSSTAGAVTPDLPVFPDNIVVFPERDFVSVEGFSGFGGQTALVEVIRPGVGVVGSAEAVVSGTDVAFEVNHPGGVCWGEGTGVNVTPDIVPGDEIVLSFAGARTAATTVLDAQASDSQLLADGVTMIVEGHIGAGVDPANFEQRIIEPALVDTVIGRRDIRALVGPPIPGPNGGYESSVAVDGTSFVATYVFDDPAVAAIAAAATGERAMTWELTDAAANRQGLTISEFGEPGGPGMGGCPNGPLQSGPPAPGGIVAARSPDGASVVLNWTPAQALPGTPAILGYRVTAVDTTPDPVTGEQAEVGRRINDPAATGTTISGLDPTRAYVVEVVSVSSVGQTWPPATPPLEVDVTAPVITASPVGGTYAVPQQVTLTADEPGVDIYYTTDGTSPLDGLGGTTAAALHYTGPIPVAASGTITFAGYDPSGNASAAVTESYAITNDPTAAQTSILSAVPAFESVELTWAPADPVAPATTITGYVVRVYETADAATATFLHEVELAGDATSTTVTGLVANHDYWFTVAARNEVNALYGPESDRFGPVAPLGAVVADAGPDQADVVRGSDVQLSGAGSSTGSIVSYLWEQIDPATGDALDPLTDPDAVELVTPNAISASFTMPFYDHSKTLGPLAFRFTVTGDNGQTASDTVLVVPRNDTIAIASARFKNGDFRVTGTGATDGAIITVRTGDVVHGSTTVVAGAWDLRLRGNAAPSSSPGTVQADSNLGATVGPFTVRT